MNYFLTEDQLEMQEIARRIAIENEAEFGKV